MKQPITSTLAYEDKKATIPSDHELIDSVLDSKLGMTYREIGYAIYKKLLLKKETATSAFQWKFNPVKVARRLKEMVKSNKIEVLEQRKCTLGNSLCNSYVKIKSA